MTSISSKPSGVFFNKQHLPAVIFFTLYLLLGLLIYTDYGLFFDDHWARENGVINGLYIAGEIAPSVLEGKNYCPECPTLGEYVDGDHGPIFELVPTFLEWALGIKDLQKVFQLRHLCTFLLFYLSTVFFYLLLQERFRKPLLSLAGVLMLVISPRMFAESFYNSKDLPFLSVSIIAAYTLILFLRKRTYKTVFWHALMCALAIDLRLLGLLFPALTLGFSIFDLRLIRKNGQLLSKTLKQLGVYFIALFAFIIMFWPYLWVKPFIRFPEVLARSSSFPAGPKFLLHFGEVIPTNDLPWHYLPVWVLITTPVLYLVLFFIGLGQTLWQTIRSKFLLYRNSEEQTDLAMAGIFVIPLVAAIVFNIVLYDSWRHFYFVYLAFIYLAVLGLAKLFDLLLNSENRFQPVLKLSLIAIFVIGIGRLSYWMIRNHPHQNVYFSIYNDDSVRQQFELDYWGLAYKQGLEFVLKDSDKPVIRVYVANQPGDNNQYAFSPEQRKRLVYVDHISKADYFLTEYRWHPADYPLQKEVYQIKVDDIKIFSVFKPDRIYQKLETHVY